MTLASHEENLAYYRKFTTAELDRFLPQAECDYRDHPCEETRRRYMAVLGVLSERCLEES